MDKRFQPHPHPNAYGVTATEGNRSVEVLRASAGDWGVFAQIDGVPCGPFADSPKSLPYPTAMRLAIAFLDGRVTPPPRATAEGSSLERSTERRTRHA